MPRPYSADLRQRVLAACDAGDGTRAEIARRFRVSESALYAWLEQRRRELGGQAAQAPPHRPKEMTRRAAEQDRPDIAHERASFQVHMKTIDPADLVFVDESGVSTDMVRRYGRAPIGERALGTAPAGHYTQLTLLGARSLQGMPALMTVEGATNTDVMVAFTEHVLVPTLRPGRVVVLDNLSPHKSVRVRELIEDAGCRLPFLPPYSPDFSPIEEAWSKVKEWLRGEGARTREAIEAALRLVLDTITAADARGRFRHRGGYVPAPN